MALSIHRSKISAVTSRSGSLLLATSRATVSIQQASAYPLASRTSAAVVKQARIPDSRSGALSRIPSTSSWYPRPDIRSASAANSSFPPGKKWYSDPIGEPLSAATCFNPTPW